MVSLSNHEGRWSARPSPYSMSHPTSARTIAAPSAIAFILP
jgi:hypothetical protein